MGEEAQRDKVTVHIRYGDVEQTFMGNVNDVWTGVNRFFAEKIPAFDIVRKVLLTVDLEKLIQDCRGVVAITQEGAAIMVSKRILTDNETLALHLLSAYLVYRLGLSDNDFLAKEELQAGLGKSSKIMSTRLGELCRKGLTAKTEKGEYRITTLGIKHLQEETLPRITEKSQA